MGSKNSIASWILSHMPAADNFYDLFCGGCSITHLAIERRRYNNFYINDIKRELPVGFLDCIKGRYREDYRWISHEEFDLLKGNGDLLVDVCFSFGNNWRKGYAYSREIEPFKKALHFAVCFGDYSLLRDEFGVTVSNLSEISDVRERMARVKMAIGKNVNLPQHLQALDRLQSLERLLGLERLMCPNMARSIENIHASFQSYDCVEIKPNSVIYCDIPYRDTAIYNDTPFDYDKFYGWCLRQTEPVFISEYDMPKEDFVCIAAQSKRVLINAQSNSQVRVEKLFIPKNQVSNKPLTLF